MARIDKKIAKLGYSVYQTVGNDPPSFIEYTKTVKHSFWADTLNLDHETTYVVRIFCSDLTTGTYAINSDYMGQSMPAVGGGREYGNVLRGINEPELKIFCRKMRQLKRRYKLAKLIHGRKY